MKKRPYAAQEAIDALNAQSAKITTERGRAWINAKTPEQKISFPAIIAVDRANPERPKLRIEAIDLLGATHVLMILHPAAAKKGGRTHPTFTVIDYDQRRIFEMRDSWHGIPLSALSELLLGLGAIPKDGTVGQAGPDGFEIRSGSNVFQYLMRWIDPGPRLALSQVEGRIGKTGERYVVHFSKFLDKDDFYLPQEVKVRGYADAKADEPTVEINVSWRQRRWNEDVPSLVFTPPATGLDGFERQ